MRTSYPTPLTSTVTWVGRASTSLPRRKVIMRAPHRLCWPFSPGSFLTSANSRARGLAGAFGPGRSRCRRGRSRAVWFLGLAGVFLPDLAHRHDGHDQQGHHPDEHDPEQYLIEHNRFLPVPVTPCPGIDPGTGPDWIAGPEFASAGQETVLASDPFRRV